MNKPAFDKELCIQKLSVAESRVRNHLNNIERWKEIVDERKKILAQAESNLLECERKLLDYQDKLSQAQIDVRTWSSNLRFFNQYDMHQQVKSGFPISIDFKNAPPAPKKQNFQLEAQVQLDSY